MKNNKNLKINCPWCNSEIFINEFHGQDEFCKQCKSWILAEFIVTELGVWMYDN